MIDFYVAERFAPEGCEFIAVLRRGRPNFASEEALQAHRLALLKGTLMDAREQISLLLDGSASDRSLLERHVRRLHAQAAYLRDLAEVMARPRKVLRLIRAASFSLLPIRRRVARRRSRI